MLSPTAEPYSRCMCFHVTVADALQVSSAEATVAAKAAALGAAEERHAELQQQRAAVDKQLLAAQRREEALQKQVSCHASTHASQPPEQLVQRCSTNAGS